MHNSVACGGSIMHFSVYLPPAIVLSDHKVPVVWFLSGLTCNHENAVLKSGIQRYASELGMCVVFPDTSPRGSDVPDDESYDLGQGASFYVDAVRSPWSKHFRMRTYIMDELQALIIKNFPVDRERQCIMGHSMGGHGALTIALSDNKGIFRSVSAFAPICNPMSSNWGRKQLAEYLGGNQILWSKYDASEMIRQGGFNGRIKVDTGAEDPYFDQLNISSLEDAAATSEKGAQDLESVIHAGYDHSYFFVSTFVGSHLLWHKENLQF